MKGVEVDAAREEPVLVADRDEDVGERGWEETDLTDGEDSIPSRCGPTDDRFDRESGESSDREDEVDARR